MGLVQKFNIKKITFSQFLSIINIKRVMRFVLLIITFGFFNF